MDHPESFKRGMRRFGFAYLLLAAALFFTLALPLTGIEKTFLFVAGVFALMMGLERCKTFKKSG